MLDIYTSRDWRCQKNWKTSSQSNKCSNNAVLESSNCISSFTDTTSFLITIQRHRWMSPPIRTPDTRISSTLSKPQLEIRSCQLHKSPHLKIFSSIKALKAPESRFTKPSVTTSTHLKSSLRSMSWSRKLTITLNQKLSKSHCFSRPTTL